MEKLLLPKYAFVDITVFMKTSEGDYLNLTDFDIASSENEKLRFESESQFIMMFHSFFYPMLKKKGIQPYICDITIDELLALAGIRDKSFLSRFVNSDKEMDYQLLSLHCARKIADYRLGKIAKTNEDTYEFYRNGYSKTSGKYKKEKNLICTKRFYQA